MTSHKNILFIMCDQLRADYLSCYGHPHLHTPHIDSLAQRGVQFSRVYVQAPVCGPSRMSIYTGRYVSSHGSMWNGHPLRVGQYTMGDYLRAAGMKTVLVGKTHHVPDLEGMARLGIDPNSEAGRRASECGFDAFERDDGLHPDPIVDPNLRYNQYLRDLGYNTENPWDRNANGVLDDDGKLLSGWEMRNAGRPANIKEEHSETPYMTDRAIEFIQSASEEPWCLHLSYIKPHWPYIAPAPYHNMYGTEHILPPNRSANERENPHPVYDAFMQMRVSQAFSRDDVRATVIPTYMGLVKQIDDQVGRLMAFLEETDRIDNTLIVFTSDHGDYLGDHWLGEKDLAHEESMRIPLIIVDPSSEAAATRGTVEDRLVESIDLLPTFLDAAGGEPQPHRLEGRSLMPLLRDEQVEWRDAVFCEIDYSGRQARNILGLAPDDCRAFVVRTDDWKYILYEGFRPQLFDLKNDPGEQVDLGDDAAHAVIRTELHERIFTWLRKLKHRTTVSEDEIVARYGQQQEDEAGIYIGVW